MRTMHRCVVPVALACVLGAAPGWVAAQAAATAIAAAPQQSVVTVAGNVGAGGPDSEPVLFAGLAAVTGKVIYDPDFGAPPVLQISVDLSRVTGKGLRSGKTYVLVTPPVMDRPLRAFDSIEVGISFTADGNPALARAAVASFGVSYSAASGVTASPMRIATAPPG